MVMPTSHEVVAERNRPVATLQPGPTVDPVHDVEARAEHRLVLAHAERLRVRHVGAV